MPRPDLTPLLPTIDDDTEMYTQQGSGVVHRFTVGQIRALINATAAPTVVSGEVSGSDLILHMSDASTITISGVFMSIPGPYASDTEAGANGVVVGQLYELSDSNPYGMKEGAVVKRKY